MLEGLQIIIARMETHPEEFIDGYWDYFTDLKDETWTIFTQEEVEALKAAKAKLENVKVQLRRERFTQMIVERLMSNDSWGGSPVKNIRTQTTTDIIRHGIEKLQEEFQYKWVAEKEGGRK